MLFGGILYSKGFRNFGIHGFFILKKKFSHISILHVYHHATMFPLWYLATRYAPGGEVALPVIVNACVHVDYVSLLWFSCDAYSTKTISTSKTLCDNHSSNNNRILLHIRKKQTQTFPLFLDQSICCCSYWMYVSFSRDVISKMINRVMIFLLYLF